MSRPLRHTLLLGCCVVLVTAVVACSHSQGGRSPDQARYRTDAGPAGRLADLGIASLSGEELWVIARSDQAPTTTTTPGRPQLFAQLPDDPGAEPRELPLEQTTISARIQAHIASVRLLQRYHNPHQAQIDVRYVLPLPHDAAVSGFVMQVGDRLIRGIIRERQQAEQIYAEACSRGLVASLMTQQRANVFTQQVANIEPGHRIEIETSYHHALPWHDGGYELVLPAAVGPRRSIGVELEAGVSIETLTSSSHQIEVAALSPSRRRIELPNGAAAPDKDLVLRWTVAGDQVKAGLLRHHDQRGGYFSLVLTPPAAGLARIDRAPVAHVFVLDCSERMNGVPLRTAKDTVRRVLARLQPDDAFQIIRVSDDVSALGPELLPATAPHIARGLAYLDRLHGSGGTAMVDGLETALAGPHQPGRVRLVSVMTDGQIGDEADILRTIHQRLGQARIFSFGVGSSPNRSLLEQMAKLGQGAVAWVTHENAQLDQKIDAFFERIAHPELSNITVDWGTMNVSEVYPSRISDLWANRPVVISGRFDGELGQPITVSGYAAGRKLAFALPISADQQPVRPAIAQLWARMKIGELAERSLWEPDREALIRAIRQAALAYGLLSRFTAFVAVDASRTIEESPNGGR